MFNKIKTLIENEIFRDSLTGAVIPILAVWLSYSLISRSQIKKESNKLSIQLEMVRRELESNKQDLSCFMENYEQYLDKKEYFNLKQPFIDDLFYDTLCNLKKIENEYFHSQGYIWEKPSVVYKLNQDIEKLENELEKVEEEYENLNKQYKEKFIIEKKAKIIMHLKEEIDSKYAEFEKNNERDIYKEFQLIEIYFDNSMAVEMFRTAGSDIDGRLGIFKYIYSNIKEFNSLKKQEKSDVINLYKKLLIHCININDFNEDEFEYYYGIRYKDNIILNAWKEFYHYNHLTEYINNYKFSLSDDEWSRLKEYIVLLNDKDLYIKIDNTYNEIKLIKELKCSENNNDDNLKKIYEKCKELNETIEYIEKQLEKKDKILDKKIHGPIKFYLKNVKNIACTVRNTHMLLEKNNYIKNYRKYI